MGFLQAFEILGMFFTNIPKDGFKFKVEAITSIMPEQETKTRFVLKSEQSQEICFNALNFVVNCLDVKSYFDKSTEMLTEIVKRIIIAVGVSIVRAAHLNKQKQKTS